MVTPPSGPLWAAVSGRAPDLWPADDEQSATELADTLTGVATSLGDAHQATTRTAGLTTTAWSDDTGNDFTDRVTQHGNRMSGLADQVRLRATAARTYATELTGAKTDITTTVTANEPVFTALGGLPGPFGPFFQDLFAAQVADGLRNEVDQRVRNVSQIQVPPPPSHEELLARYQVDDDPLGMVELFGNRVSVAELGIILELGPLEVQNIKEDAEARTANVFPGEGRDPDKDVLDNHRDAFRHAYLNARLAAEFGEDGAARLGTAHEFAPDPTPRDNVVEAMDLHNNEVGRRIAAEHPGASPDELSQHVQQAVRDGRMVVMDEHDRLVPSNTAFNR